MAKPSLKLKLLISLFSAVLFALLSLPVVYVFTNGLAKSVGLSFLENGVPTPLGIAVHAIVFAVIAFLLM